MSSGRQGLGAVETARWRGVLCRVTIPSQVPMLCAVSRARHNYALMCAVIREDRE